MSVGLGVRYFCEAKGNFAALVIAARVTAQFGYDPENFTNDPNFWASHFQSDDRDPVFGELGFVFVKKFHRHE
jgi:hypothetical protein